MCPWMDPASLRSLIRKLLFEKGFGTISPRMTFPISEKEVLQTFGLPLACWCMLHCAVICWGVVLGGFCKIPLVVHLWYGVDKGQGFHQPTKSSEGP